MQRLQDSFGRHFSYLRLSVTDACNFKCAYCLPQGYKKGADENEPLSVAEIRNLVAAFAELGTWKVRVTGGEPTLRRDLPEIISAISKTEGIRKVALSTNGNRLRAILPGLIERGLGAINVSVDTLDPKRFYELTGSARLQEILEGVRWASAEARLPVKINAVLLKETTTEHLEAFLGWVRTAPVTVRFIELMRTGGNEAFHDRHHVTAGVLRQSLLSRGWKERERSEGDGPALEFVHPEYIGRVGIIAPYSSDFCRSCNRLRVTSRGGLRLCLFAEGEHSLRHLLQDESQLEELKAELCRLISRKEVSHYLPEGRYGDNRTFSAVGG